MKVSTCFFLLIIIGCSSNEDNTALYGVWILDTYQMEYSCDGEKLDFNKSNKRLERTTLRLVRNWDYEYKLVNNLSTGKFTLIDNEIRFVESGNGSEWTWKIKNLSSENMTLEFYECDSKVNWHFNKVRGT